MAQNLIAFKLGDKFLLNETAGSATVDQKYGAIASFINLLLPNIFIISGLIMLILLIGGGFSIVASGGNAKSVESGKNQIMSAVIGFIIIFAAYWIILIIEKFTGVPIFNSNI